MNIDKNKVMKIRDVLRRLYNDGTKTQLAFEESAINSTKFKMVQRACVSMALTEVMKVFVEGSNKSKKLFSRGVVYYIEPIGEHSNEELVKFFPDTVMTDLKDEKTGRPIKAWKCEPGKLPIFVWFRKAYPSISFNILMRKSDNTCKDKSLVRECENLD